MPTSLSGQAAVGRRGGEALFFAAVFLVLLACDFPGMLSIDSRTQLAQALAGHLVNGHSPVMGIVWQGLNRIYSGPALYLVICLALTTGALHAIFGLAFRTWQVRCGALLFIAFYPSDYIVGSWVTKDSVCRALLLVAFAVVAGCVLEKRTTSSYALRGLAAFVVMFLAIDVRPDAVAASFPLVIWLLSPVFLKAESLSRQPVIYRISAVAGVACFVMLVAVESARYVDTWIAGKPVHTEQVVMLDDIVSISVQSGVNRVPASLFQEPADLQVLKQQDRPYSFEYLFWDSRFGPPQLRLSLTDEEFNEECSAWFASIRDHPGFYLQHRIEKFRYFMGLTGDYFGAMASLPPDQVENGRYAGLEASHTYLYPNIVSRGEQALYQSKIFGPLRRPVVYALAMLVCLVAAVRMKGADSRLVQLIGALTASGYFHLALLFLFGTQASSRFAAWSMLAGMLTVTLFVGAWIESRWKAAQ